MLESSVAARYVTQYESVANKQVPGTGFINPISSARLVCDDDIATILHNAYQIKQQDTSSKQSLPGKLDLPRRFSGLESALGHAYPLALGQFKLVFVRRPGARAVVWVVDARWGLSGWHRT